MKINSQLLFNEDFIVILLNSSWNLLKIFDIQRNFWNIFLNIKLAIMSTDGGRVFWENNSLYSGTFLSFSSVIIPWKYFRNGRNDELRVVLFPRIALNLLVIPFFLAVTTATAEQNITIRVIDFVKSLHSWNASLNWYIVLFVSLCVSLPHRRLYFDLQFPISTVFQFQCEPYK